MLLSKKTTGPFNVFLGGLKVAYLIVRQLEKITVRKAQAKVRSKMPEKQMLGP